MLEIKRPVTARKSPLTGSLVDWTRLRRDPRRVRIQRSDPRSMESTG